ncbi:MAG: DUF2442 domain-containing protein [Candidatus Palauibacterales bacterium]|nr:DUF2442 domain-containing protein [Candidatus Palauibacterales bacterium]MDP2529270.1 DUF2442 domain-containing protein [Candidatus Palauibacterales bacterium]
MTTLKLDTEPRVVRVEVTGGRLLAHLADERVLSVPLAWFPRLVHATPEERARYDLIGGGYGIHWPDLDEDISVEGLLAGRRSGESQRSFERWLRSREGADSNSG